MKEMTTEKISGRWILSDGRKLNEVLMMEVMTGGITLELTGGGDLTQEKLSGGKLTLGDEKKRRDLLLRKDGNTHIRSVTKVRERIGEKQVYKDAKAKCENYGVCIHSVSE